MIKLSHMKISRKSIFYLLIVLLTVLGVYALVRLSRPEEAPIIHHSTGSYDLRYDAVNEYAHATGKPVKIFLYSSKDADSQLVVRNMLDALKAENNVTVFPDLLYVDMAEYDGKDADLYVLNNWSVHRYPAFFVLSVEDSKVSISHLLEWVPDAPYSIEDVRNWLTEEEFIKKPDE